MQILPIFEIASINLEATCSKHGCIGSFVTVTGFIFETDIIRI